MAVPARRNGLREDEEDEEVVVGGDEELFNDDEEEEPQGWLADADIPAHLLALAEASEAGNLDGLRDALDNLTVSIDVPIEDGDTALHLCCLYGYLPCVQLLLERGASPNITDEEGAIPLHDACAGGFTEIVQLLLNAGSPETVQQMLNTADVEGDTPLHHAARGEHLSVVRLLVSAGASPKRINVYGKTPAELADPETEVSGLLQDAAASAITTPCQ